MSLIARLIEAGTPADLIEEVAMMVAEKRAAERAIEDARAKARDRQARKRERDLSRYVTESNVTDCDIENLGLSRPPNENISNPPTHTHPDNTLTRARADKFPCPDGVDPLDWAGLLANRKAKRAALSEGAHRQIVRKLEGWTRDGWPPGPIVAYAVERGWTTVFETDEMKGLANGRQNGYGSLRGTRPNPALDMVLEAEREIQAERQNQGADWPVRAALPPH